MAFNHSTTQPRQGEIATKLADAAKVHGDQPAEAPPEATDDARDGANATANLNERAAEDAKRLFQTGVDAAAHHANEASERVTRAFGLSGEANERLVLQSKENMDVVTRCGTVLTQAFQDASRGWLELSQKQWQRNLEGMKRLAGTKSIQEFATTQSELVREGLEHMVQDSRAIAATSLKAMEQARDTFPNIAHQKAA